jgi:hypothetical protein
MVTSYHFQKTSRHFVKTLTAFVMMLVCAASSAIAGDVKASLDRDSVPAGMGAILTLTITGGSVELPEIPEVENFVVQPRGQGQNMQIIDGRRTFSLTYKYVVGSNTPGDYQIPAFEVTVDGKKYPVQPLKLKVLDSAAAQPPAGAAPTPQNQQPPAEAEETGEKRFGFLTVELADSKRTHAYVGEIAPVRIQAWLPGGAQAQLKSNIQPEGNGFTLHNVSERPQQTQEERDGKLYTVVTWFGGISATKAGKLPASLSVDAIVAVRDNSAPKPQRRRTGSAFDDPFFDDAFDRMNTPMIQKDVTLKSDDQEIEVRPLPTEGRPDGFSGAIGEFKFDMAEIPKDWKTGEPQQITTRLSGSGNFSRMKAPAVSPENAWKVYPGKDEFTPVDQASFSGSKIFQFSAVPRKGGEQNVSLSFSYFDPAAEAYKTITSPVEKIRATGADLVEVQPVAEPAVKEPERKKSDGMIAQHETMSSRGLLVPLVSRQAFIEMLGTSGLLCVLGAIFGFVRVRREDPKRRAREATEKATREAVEAAGAAKDVPGFFAAARLAIQQRLGALWGQPAQAITTAEINARIDSDSPVARFFQEADRYEYSRRDSGEILPQWRSLLEEALASLTSTTR